MNNKGFTVVELIAAFSITMVISVFLFELLIEVKDIFVETSLKTNIEEKMAIISKNINNLFIDENKSIDECSGNTCKINEKTITIYEHDIVIGDQKFTMPKDGNETITITEANIVNEALTGTEGYVKVNFTLESPNLSKQYIYNVVFYYN